MQTLVERYANDYLLKKRHLQALFDIPSAKGETAASMHALVDEFQRHTKVLGQLGEPTGSWSTFCVQSFPTTRSKPGKTTRQLLMIRITTALSSFSSVICEC